MTKTIDDLAALAMGIHAATSGLRPSCE